MKLEYRLSNCCFDCDLSKRVNSRLMEHQTYDNLTNQNIVNVEKDFFCQDNKMQDEIQTAKKSDFAVLPHQSTSCSFASALSNDTFVTHLSLCADIGAASGSRCCNICYQNCFLNVTHTSVSNALISQMGLFL